MSEGLSEPAPFKLGASQLLPLTARNDAAAARRAAGHLGAILLCAGALWAVRAWCGPCR